MDTKVDDFNENKQDETEKSKNLDIKYREEFLYFLKRSQQKKASVRLLEGSNELNCRIEAYEPNLKHLAVSDLQTPIGIQKYAILRHNDIVDIKFSKG